MTGFYERFHLELGDLLGTYVLRGAPPAVGGLVRPVSAERSLLARLVGYSARAR
jgi:hypothetical protein